MASSYARRPVAHADKLLRALDGIGVYFQQRGESYGIETLGDLITSAAQADTTKEIVDLLCDLCKNRRGGQPREDKEGTIPQVNRRAALAYLQVLQWEWKRAAEDLAEPEMPELPTLEDVVDG